jgi:nucleotide-binding universal stress UspA family protein
VAVGATPEFLFDYDSMSDSLNVMTIVAAIPDSAEGALALSHAVAEAKLLGTDLVAVNLALRSLDVSELDSDVQVTVVDRSGRADRDPVDAVLDEISERKATRLVIGVMRRTPISKVVLGSISERLLMNSPVPVLAVKLPFED